MIIGKRRVVETLNGAVSYPVPIWMMRQAGRYLPEYKELRKTAGTFLDLCYTPEFAVEATLQPIRRFGFDAAILFSDILVVPHALGRDLTFEEGRGPVMTPIQAEEIERLNGETFHVNLSTVYDAVRQLRARLPDETTLIGFCGAPWTLATYMIAGHGTPDQAPARMFGYRHPQEMAALLGLLADYCASYLIKQIEAGADVVQIFDSWSGVLDQVTFQRWCVEPVKRIVRQVRAVYPDVTIIGFPRGAGRHYDSYRQITGVTALGCDWTMPLSQLKQLQTDGCVQGNLDPLRLVAGGDALREGVAEILDAAGRGPLIFNLGHGITPETPISHVEAMIKQVRDWRP